MPFIAGATCPCRTDCAAHPYPPDGLDHALSHTGLPPALLALLPAGCSAETDAPVSAAPDAALAKRTTAAAESEDALVARALAIHDRVLTFDSHADTPLRMIEPGFDMAERHDPNDTGSKVDYPRMQEGGLDAIFFAAFVAWTSETTPATAARRR